jgi:hypothetical protein
MFTRVEKSRIWPPFRTTIICRSPVGDFLAGADLDSGQPDVLLKTILRLFMFLSGGRRSQNSSLSRFNESESLKQAERRIPARDRERADRQRMWAARNRYFKLYKSQIPVIEQAIETAALMLCSDKSHGYCLEMICADFLAGANLDNGQPDVLLRTMSRLFTFLPGAQKQAFAELATEQIQWIRIC